MKTKSMKDICKLSFKYTILNKKVILILGILLILKEFVFVISPNLKDLLLIPIGILMIFLFLFYVGFLVYFVEEVISNPENPPKANPKIILKKGLDEIIFYVLYLAFIFLAYMLFSLLEHSLADFTEPITTVKVLVISFLSLLPMTAVVNVFLHDENIKHGFKIKEVVNLILNLKTSKFIWLVILSLIAENLVLANFKLINNVFYVDGVNMVFNLVITPFILIFLQFVKTIAILTSTDNKYYSSLLNK